VHRADPDEADGGTGLRVVAPHRDLAGWAARDPLALAARRGRRDELWFARDVLDAIGLVERIERMHGAGLALAPAAMTGVDDQRPPGRAIAALRAGASAFHARLRSQCPRRARAYTALSASRNRLL